jgi:hypothetical protein
VVAACSAASRIVAALDLLGLDPVALEYALAQIFWQTTTMMTYLGLVLAAFLRADQHKEGFDMQVAGRCAIRQVAQSDIGALFLFPFIVKSGALLILLVADVVR